MVQSDDFEVVSHQFSDDARKKITKVTGSDPGRYIFLRTDKDD